MGVAHVTIRPHLDPAPMLTLNEFRELAEAILDVLGLEHAQLSLTIVDDAEMAVLHQRHLNRTGPTNILSFESNSPDADDYIGEAVLSVDTLLRECDLYGQPVQEHLIRLLAHGFLHLAGLDHGLEMDTLTEQAIDALAPEE